MFSRVTLRWLKLLWRWKDIKTSLWLRSGSRPEPWRRSTVLSPPPRSWRLQAKQNTLKYKTHKKGQKEGWNIQRVAGGLSVLTHSSQSHCGLELTSDLSVSDGTLHHTDGSLRVSSALAVWLIQRPTPEPSLGFSCCCCFCLQSEVPELCWRGLGVPCQEWLAALADRFSESQDNVGKFVFAGLFLQTVKKFFKKTEKLTSVHHFY